MAARQWWDGLRLQYQDQGIRFDAPGELNGLALPADLFNHVVENLLQNALEKRRGNRPLSIDARIEMVRGERRLRFSMSCGSACGK